MALTVSGYTKLRFLIDRLATPLARATPAPEVSKNTAPQRLSTKKGWIGFMLRVNN